MHSDFDSLYSSFNKTLNSKLDSVLIIDGVSASGFLGFLSVQL